MTSPLEVDPGIEPNDSRQPSAGDRRGQRDQVSVPQPYSLSENRHVLALPFVFLILVLQSMFQLMKQFVGDPASMVREFFAVNQEVNHILQELPEEQKEQRRQIENAHEEQIDQRHKLEVLQRRIQALEERRAARESNHEIPDLKITPE